MFFFKKNTNFEKEETSIKVMIYKDFNATGKCRLFIAKEPFHPNQCAFALKKSDPLSRKLSHEYI